MKISIIVPIYNSEQYIERLINSVLIQDYTNYELILVDDGSVDNTYEIIKKYEGDKVKVYSKNNEGVGKTRKFGFEHSNGDLIYFCDSDDYLASTEVLKEINDIYSTQNIDLLMFDALDITYKGEKIVNSFSIDFKEGLHEVSEINNCFLYGSLIFKVFKREKMTLDCFCDDNNFEDTYTTYKYLNNCKKFYYLKKVFYVADEVINPNSLTKNKPAKKFIKTIDLVKKIYNESTLKQSCIISAFNYYLHMIEMLSTQNWNINEQKKVKSKMLELEVIFYNHLKMIIEKEPEKIDIYLNFKNNLIGKKIIFIDGASTTGKSSISYLLYNQLKLNKINAVWLHEEVEGITDLLLNIPKHKKIKKELLQIEMNNLINKWHSFSKQINSDNKVYILDSNFFKNIHDYLLYNDISIQDIQQFINDILNVFLKEEVYFIFLKRENIKQSLIDSFENRGEFWKNKIMKRKEIINSFSNITLTVEEEAIYKFEEKYQLLIEKIFDNFKIDKKKIVTDKEMWKTYVFDILRTFEINMIYNEQKTYDIQKYIGKYHCEDWNIELFYNDSIKKMCLSLFWPNIELDYIGNNSFSVFGFPLKLSFVDDKLYFTGPLDWNMKNKEFVKQKKLTPERKNKHEAK